MVTSSESDIVQAPVNPLTVLQSTVLSGLVSLHADLSTLSARMAQVVVGVRDEHMSGPLYQIWKTVMRYYSMSGAIPDPAAFDSLLSESKRLAVSDRIALSKQYAGLASEPISEARFRISIVRLGDLYRSSQFGDVLQKALSIHTGQATINGKVLSGHDDSKSFLSDALTKLETESSVPVATTSVSSDVAVFLQEYALAKKVQTPGVLTGFIVFDGIARGLHPSDLCLVGGYTSEGKSKLVYNVAWHAAITQGKNVLILTNETTPTQVRRNIIVRHSAHPKFNRQRGLIYTDVRFGSLSPSDEDTLKAVLQDLRSSKDYGRIVIQQLPHRAHSDTIAEAIERLRKLHPVDLLIIDYLGLMSANRRQTRREELDDLLVRSKNMAVEHAIPILSPWQISRLAWQEAQKRKAYTLAALSDTSQAEKSSDVILTILRMPDDTDIIKCQLLKNRDGESGLEFDLETDFATCLVGARRAKTDLLAV